MISALLLWTRLLAMASLALPSGPLPREGPEESLWEAAKRGSVKEIEDLLARGADINARTRYGATALHFASDRGHLEVVRLLLEKGAEVDAEDFFYSATPLGWALSNGHVDVARAILEKGPKDAADALDFAVFKGDLELAKAALATGRVDSGRLTATLTEARKRDSSEEVVRLLEESLPDAPAPPEFKADPAKLRSFAGLYKDDESGETVRVSAAGAEGLRLDGAAISETIFRATGESSFKGEDGSAEIRFSGRGGIVERLVVARNDSFQVFYPFDPKAETAAETLIEADGAGGDHPRGEPRNWPSFRGPNGSGTADGQGAPVRWNPADGANIAWKTAIPGIANSSPIVWGDRIFVTTAVSQADDRTFRTGLYGDVAPVEDLSEHSWRVYCLSKSTGDILWEKVAHVGRPGTKRHTKASQANSTPVTDGKRLVVLFGSIGALLSYDMDGNLLWKKDIGVLNSSWFYDADYQWGHASSPILYKDLVIVQADVAKDSFIAAWKLETGELAWRTPRDTVSTWGTPALYTGGERDELVANGPVIRAYDPSTGKPLWSLGPSSEVVVATPVIAHDLIFLTAGYPPVRPVYAVRPGGDGDISPARVGDTGPFVAWSLDRGGTYIPTPLVYGDYLYLLHNDGRLICLQARTGKVVYRQRVGGTGGSFTASPVAADGKLYFTSEDGDVFVVKAGPHYEELAKNRMNEVCVATPAISDGLMVIRTLGHVYGVREETAAR